MPAPDALGVFLRPRIVLEFDLALNALASLPTPPHTRKQVWVYEPARGRTPAHWRVIDTQRRKA